ncbi:MAG: phage tail tape measure protein [Rhodobacter sp.]|nr:phage tail tape measure protein [Rhodobacter sp.]
MIEIDSLSERLTALESACLASAGGVGGLNSELGKMQGGIAQAGREVTGLTSGIGSGLRRAFDGARLSDALKGIGQTLSDTAYRAATRPVTDALSGLLARGVGGLMSAVTPFANGGVIAQGRVTPFARGGVVTGPTGFAMRGGQGLMGEAGPEAILPLSRGADGRLGVQSAGGGGRGVSVVMNVSTPDVQGFQRSQGQIAAQVNRMLARGQRNR